MTARRTRMIRSPRWHMATFGGTAAVLFPLATWGHLGSWTDWVPLYLITVSLAALFGFAVHAHLIAERRR